jgi:hypothetical protein
MMRARTVDCETKLSNQIFRCAALRASVCVIVHALEHKQTLSIKTISHTSKLQPPAGAFHTFYDPLFDLWYGVSIIAFGVYFHGLTYMDLSAFTSHQVVCPKRHVLVAEESINQTQNQRGTP